MKLTTEARKRLPNSAFAGKDRTYPVNDKSHARNALARASEEHKKGSLSAAQKRTIDRRANEVLYGQSSKPKTDGSSKVANAMKKSKRS